MFHHIRRKLSMEILQTNERHMCAIDENPLKRRLKLGHKGIPAGGDCRVCKVRVGAGEVSALGPISEASTVKTGGARWSSKPDGVT